MPEAIGYVFLGGLILAGGAFGVSDWAKRSGRIPLQRVAFTTALVILVIGTAVPVIAFLLTPVGD